MSFSSSKVVVVRSFGHSSGKKKKKTRLKQPVSNRHSSRGDKNAISQGSFGNGRGPLCTRGWLALLSEVSKRRQAEACDSVPDQHTQLVSPTNPTGQTTQGQLLSCPLRQRRSIISCFSSPGLQVHSPTTYSTTKLQGPINWPTEHCLASPTCDRIVWPSWSRSVQANPIRSQILSAPALNGLILSYRPSCH